MINVTPVILCGGSGTRLWPLSRADFPKQFLSLTGSESLFQQSARRLECIGAPDISIAKPFISTGEDHGFLVIQQLREISMVPGAVLVEPVARNTAPALTLAALAAQADGHDPVLIVTPADHSVADPTAFSEALKVAVREAALGATVTLGITPDRPEIAYGYIQVSRTNYLPSLPVQKFVEKPDLHTAQQYLTQGDYFWNAGIFVLKASVWLSAIQAFRSDIAEATRRAWVNRTTQIVDGVPFLRLRKQDFTDIPAESIDYAVMEHCPGSSFPINVVPLLAGWNDLGAWDAVWDILPKDELNNAHAGDVICADSRNTLVHASDRLVTLVGVENLIVIETSDAVLVANKSSSQDVKKIVSQLQKAGRQEHWRHAKACQPWGWYETVCQHSCFQVKLIHIYPGAQVSPLGYPSGKVQLIATDGAVHITEPKGTVELAEGQAASIHTGVDYRIANPGATPVTLIEVHTDGEVHRANAKVNNNIV